MTDILTLARENGFSHIGFANMAALTPLEEVRKMCSADRCGKWNANWSCPPACGSIEYAKRRIAQYNKCLIVQTTGELADEFDYEGMQSTAKAHKRAFLNFVRQARMLHPDCLPLTAGSVSYTHLVVSAVDKINALIPVEIKSDLGRTVNVISVV